MQANPNVYFSYTQCVGVKLMVRIAISCPWFWLLFATARTL